MARLKRIRICSGNLILGECKYWQEPVGANIFRELERKAGSVNWRKEVRQVWYVLFSASGFTGELKEIAAERGDLLLIDEQSDPLDFERKASENKNPTEYS